MKTLDASLIVYLDRVVGEHGRCSITSVFRYDSWAELPYDPAIGPPLPLPLGPALMIGFKDRLVGKGEEVFVALPDMPKEPLAVAVAAQVVRALKNWRGAGG